MLSVNEELLTFTFIEEEELLESSDISNPHVTRRTWDQINKWLNASIKARFFNSFEIPNIIVFKKTELEQGRKVRGAWFGVKERFMCVKIRTLWKNEDEVLSCMYARERLNWWRLAREKFCMQKNKNGKWCFDGFGERERRATAMEF